MTSDQFQSLLADAQFIIATWHGVLGAVIFGLSSLLWKRINANEKRTDAEFKDLTQYTRHEVRDLHASVNSSMALILEQSGKLQERHDRLLDQSAHLQQELTTLRERIRRIEERYERA